MKYDDDTIELAKQVVTSFWNGDPGRDPDAFYDLIVRLNNVLVERHDYIPPDLNK